VHGITETVRKEVAEFNVRVCLISPGVVDTHLLEHGTTDDVIVERYRDSVKKECGSAVLTAKDVAGAVLFAFEAPPNGSFSETPSLFYNVRWQLFISWDHCISLGC